MAINRFPVNITDLIREGHGDPQMAYSDLYINGPTPSRTGQYVSPLRSQSFP